MREFERKMMALSAASAVSVLDVSSTVVYTDNVNSNQDNAPAIGAPANDDNTLEVYADPADEAWVVFNGTNFPDATFRAYLSTTFGFTEGMTLTSVQLNRVSAVDVRSKNITSLKGIEYFKNLQMYIMEVIYIIKF